MNFGDAVEEMKSGEKVSRQNWNGKGQWVALQNPNEQSKMRLPYFYLSPVDGGLVPWVPSVSDILAEDWMIVQ